jgi:hypothetical protein
LKAENIDNVRNLKSAPKKLTKAARKNASIKTHQRKRMTTAQKRARFCDQSFSEIKSSFDSKEFVIGNHRNLSTRRCMFELLLQTFWAKKLVKNLLISTLDKVIYYIGTFLQGSTKPLFTSQNRVESS